MMRTASEPLGDDDKENLKYCEKPTIDYRPYEYSPEFFYSVLWRRIFLAIARSVA
jgi:hypothetical protein